MAVYNRDTITARIGYVYLVCFWIVRHARKSFAKTSILRLWSVDYLVNYSAAASTADFHHPSPRKAIQYLKANDLQVKYTSLEVDIYCWLSYFYMAYSSNY